MTKNKSQNPFIQYFINEAKQKGIKITNIEDLPPEIRNQFPGYKQQADKLNK